MKTKIFFLSLVLCTSVLIAQSTDAKFSDLETSEKVEINHHDFFPYAIIIYPDSGEINFGGQFDKGDIFVATPRYYFSSFIIKKSINRNLKIANLSPNPAKDILNFNANLRNVNIYTLQGQKVMEDITGQSINISKLLSGTYILLGLDQKGNKISARFIKD